jgi:dihydroorotase-like cyclic amidohydrolase
MTQLVRGGLIFDAVHPEPYKADILVKDGKIKQIGEGIKAPEAQR